MLKSRKRSFALLALSALVGLGLGLAQAADDDAPVLQYRQKLMEGQGASMGSIGDILKHKLPYGSKHIAAHAKILSETAKLIPDAFKKKVATGLTDAKPEIWQNWADFVAKAKALQDAATKLAAAADGGDMKAVMPHVKAVGEACKGCHSVYRKPKEERFPRK